MTLMMPVACAVSYAVLEAASRVRAAYGPTRVIWLVVGSFVVGMSIWAMHFVALLELRGPLPLSEDPVTLGVAALTAGRPRRRGLHPPHRRPRRGPAPGGRG